MLDDVVDIGIARLRGQVEVPPDQTAALLVPGMEEFDPSELDWLSSARTVARPTSRPSAGSMPASTATCSTGCWGPGSSPAPAGTRAGW